MIDAALTSPFTLAIGAGILVTALLGLLCSPFLNFRVTVKIPDEFKAWEPAQKAGGGSDLGLLERLLFFAAVWQDSHVIAGAWLAFKVAAKWAAWQHIAKLPVTFKDEDDRKYLNARFQLSSNLLGRFLNGTLYNIFCAGVGALCGKALSEYIYFVPADDLRYWVVGVYIFIVVLIGWPLIGSPLMAKLESLWNRARTFFHRGRKIQMQKFQKMTVERMSEKGLSGEWWENDLYRVLVVKGKSWNERPVIQLSIKRHDGKPIDSWSDKQMIKNQLVGDECEGVEIYPAESRLNDQVNAYHLWVVDDCNFRFPFAWLGRAMVLDDDEKGELEEE
jgi:hypothetical protein